MNRQAWYSDALEVLSPLRYHASQILENTHPHRSGDEHQCEVPKRYLKELEEALAKAEEFFIKK